MLDKWSGVDWKPIATDWILFDTLASDRWFRTENSEPALPARPWNNALACQVYVFYGRKSTVESHDCRTKRSAEVALVSQSSNAHKAEPGTSGDRYQYGVNVQASHWPKITEYVYRSHCRRSVWNRQKNHVSTRRELVLKCGISYLIYINKETTESTAIYRSWSVYALCSYLNVCFKLFYLKTNT